MKHKYFNLIRKKIKYYITIQDKYKNISMKMMILIILFVLTFSSIVYANSKLNGVDIITDENREEIEKEHLAKGYIVKQGETEPEVISSKIYNDDIIKDKSIIDMYNINNIETKYQNGIYEIPELSIMNSFMALFTKENKEGWKLKEGDSVNISLMINTDIMSDYFAKKGVSIIIGYVIDGEYNEIGLQKDVKSYQHNLIAEKEGIYYFILANACSDRIFIQNAVISDSNN